MTSCKMQNDNVTPPIPKNFISVSQKSRCCHFLGENVQNLDVYVIDSDNVS